MHATDGGYSIFYLKPDWQVGVPNSGSAPARGVPDVSFSANSTHDGYVYYMNGTRGIVGGTSAGTPVFAGMLALLNEYLGTNGVGNINPNLYRLAQSTSNVFHDITSGNNFHLCKKGTTDCPNGGSVGYVAEPGWDAVTGLGSLDAYNMVTQWGGGIVGTITSAVASPTAITLSGQTVITVTVKAAGSSVTPTGSVAFTLGGTSIGTATLSGSGPAATAQLTIFGSQLTTGNDVISITYSGDRKVNGSTATVAVVVSVPATSSAVIPTIMPNPIFQSTPDAQGYSWFYTIRLSEAAGTSTTFTGFTIDGTDYSSSIAAFFGTATIPANGTLSASLRANGLTVPATRVFGFTGRDLSGRTWTQQTTAKFLGAQISASMQLVGLPATVRRDPTKPPDCQYSQSLGIQELNGHSVTLTRFLAAGNDYTNLLTDLFGSAVLPAFGSRQTGLCWDLRGDTLPETLTYQMDGIDDQGNAVRTTASAYFEVAASNPGTLTTSADANDEVIVMTASDSTKSATTTMKVNVSSGQAWSLTTFPSNRTASWLVVYPQSGTGPATVNIAASAAGLSDGLRQATLIIQSANSLPQFIPVALNFVVGRPQITSIVNGASLANTALSPGLIFTLFGTGLGPNAGQSMQLDTNGNVSGTLSGISVTVNGSYSPLLYVGQNQINAVAPYEITRNVGGTAQVQVLNNGVVSATTNVSVVATAPAVFSPGGGQGSIRNQDGSVNGPSNPAARGSIISIYGTGEGQTNPPGVDGAIASETLAGLPRPAAPFSVSIGGIPASYTYAGTAPQSFAGFFQVNAVIPVNAGTGSIPVILMVGGVSSRPLSVAIR